MGVFRGCELTLGYIAHSVYRIVQLALALAVCGLYGVDLHRANREHKYSDGKWVYAEVTASMSAVTAVVYLIPFIARVPFLFVWDLILFILWIALFGIFGKLYIKENAEGDSGIIRMKHAVWIDLVNALLWLFSAVAMAVYHFKHRNNKSRWTGRATV